MNDTATGSAEHRRVLAFMAHPDDAEIFCAGTLLRLAQAGWEVHIATVAAGDCGSTTEPPEAIAARRAEEARRSAALVPATYHCLGERDGFVVYDRPTLRKCADLFRRVAPQLVLTHSADDYMMDHVMTSLLGRAASFLYAAPNASTLPLVARLAGAAPLLLRPDGGRRSAGPAGRADDLRGHFDGAGR